MWTLSFLYINLKLRAKFQISRLLISDFDWLNFIHFSGYKSFKYKIRLGLILRKREDHALISISTIIKFPAQMFFTWTHICEFTWLYTCYSRTFIYYIYMIWCYSNISKINISYYTLVIHMNSFFYKIFHINHLFLSIPYLSGKLTCYICDNSHILHHINIIVKMFS